MQKGLSLLAVAGLLSGCAGLHFYDVDSSGHAQGNDRIAFYETKPTVLVAYGADCSVSFSVLSLPGAKRWVRMKSGYGSNKLGINFGAGGTLSSVNQETDTKIPETITAVGGALKNLADANLLSAQLAAKPDQKVEVKECHTHADLYNITDGELSKTPRPFAPTYTSHVVAVPQPPAAVANEIIKQCRAAIAGEPTGLPPAIAAAHIQWCKDNGLK